MTLRFLAWVTGQIVEEHGRKVSLAVRLIGSDLNRLSMECQWGESPVRGSIYIYMPEVEERDLGWRHKTRRHQCTGSNQSLAKIQHLTRGWGYKILFHLFIHSWIQEFIQKTI